MENNETNTPMHSEHESKSLYFILATVAILILGGIVLLYITQPDIGNDTGLKVPSQTRTPEAVILNEVDNIDIGDLDAEFNDIDSDLNTL